MKAILISIKPKWVAKILNGIKNIELRRNKVLATAIQKLIDEYGYADIYVYCSKDKKNYLYWDWYDPPYVEEEWFVSKNPKIWSDDRKNINGPFNGKIKFKFRCYKVEEISYQKVFEDNPFHFLEEESGYGTETLNANEFKKETCLTDKELEDYLNTDKPNKRAYAIHISDLEIFAEPKELSEFYKVGFSEALKNSLKTRPFPISPYSIEKEYQLTKVPQNMVYIEIEDSTHI